MNRILLLLAEQAERRLLADCLEPRCQVLPADSDAALVEPFELLVLDLPTLDRLAERVQARKRAEEPAFLPCLLVANRSDAERVAPYSRKGVDELVFRPLEPVEVRARAEVLLRARRLAAELRQRTAELAEAGRHKDEFLGTLAHELRNRLAPVRNAVHILRLAGNDAAKIESARGMIDRQVGQMVRTVDDLLEVSRVSRGTVELNRQPVALAAVMASALDAVRPVLDAAGHELTLVPAPADLVVEADPARLAQALANLLHNAAKFTEPGGRVEVSGGREAGRAVVRVRDSGIGIAPTLLPRIFEPFARGDRPGTRPNAGLGIGLALARSLIELHGGQVAAHSDGPGRGSEFVVRLPLARSGEPAVPQGARRVLVVDDLRDARESLATLLRLLGQEVRTVHDGAAALAEASAFRPDLVFLDIAMPGMDGYQVARRLREQPELRGARLIALTGFGREEDRRRALAVGFERHLVKPVSADTLREILASGRGPT